MQKRALISNNITRGCRGVLNVNVYLLAHLTQKEVVMKPGVACNLQRLENKVQKEKKKKKNEKK